MVNWGGCRGKLGGLEGVRGRLEGSVGEFPAGIGPHRSEKILFVGHRENIAP